jgi:hypothetical protein
MSCKKFFLADGQYMPYVSSYDEGTDEYAAALSRFSSSYHSFVEVPERPDDFCTWNTESHEWEFDLQSCKIDAINYVSGMSFSLRQALLPEYKLMNASLGVYPENEKAAYLSLVLSFRNEFYRLKSLIESVSTAQEINAIVASADFPDVIPPF